MAAPYIQLQKLLAAREPDGLRMASSPEPSSSSDCDDGSQEHLMTNQHSERSPSPFLQTAGKGGVAGDNTATLIDESSSRQSTYSDVLRWWVPEIVASALSVGSFMSIVVLLSVYDRCAVDRLNMPLGLTLNGILALLATIGKVCLCAPVCSGLLQEMWLYFVSESEKRSPKSRLKDLGLFVRASHGALGSLEFLAHPSLAKTVAIFGCLMMILSLAFGTFIQQLVTFKITRARHTGAIGNIPRSEEWAAKDYVATLEIDPMQAALYSNFFSNNTPPISPSCPSGDCLWPTTPSLAVCGECKQQSYQLLGCYELNGTSCDYSLASGEIVVLSKITSQEPTSGTSSTSFYSIAKGVNTTDEKLHLFQADLFGYVFDGSIDGSTASDPVYNECSLWVCIQYYNTTVSSGQHSQQVVGVNDEIGSEYTRDGESWIPIGNKSEKDPHFAASMRAVTVVSTLVGFNLYGTVDENSTPTNNGSDFLPWLWLRNTADADAWIKNAATGLTNVLRSDSSRWQRDEYNGTQHDLAVEVRWIWIALPAALVLSSLFFLITVIIRTVHSPVQSWKGSPLALLLFDLDRAIRDVATERLEQHNGVEEAVGEQTIRLVQTRDKRWKFDAA